MKLVDLPRRFMITTTRRPRFTMDLMEAGGGNASLPVILGETGYKIAKVKLGEKKEEFYNINPTLLVILIQPLALIKLFREIDRNSKKTQTLSSK
ncbi:hypothetical protein LXL04_019590 [Taraxacum kok-saghyz]